MHADPDIPRRPDAPLRLQSLDAAVDLLLERVPGPLHVGAPLGLGKPHRLLNALFTRIEAIPRVRCTSTPRCRWIRRARRTGWRGASCGRSSRATSATTSRAWPTCRRCSRDALPAHVRVEEFYLQSGALLGSTQAQRRYASLNYTHVARALAERGINVVRAEGGRVSPMARRLSLSCNTDLTFDLLDAILRRCGRPRPLMVAEVDPRTALDRMAARRWMRTSSTSWSSPPGPYPQLFALPRQPVNDADYAIGFYASTLVRDGGTLQIGIGALADALCHALALRHTDNAAYRRVLRALDPGSHASPR